MPSDPERQSSVEQAARLHALAANNRWSHERQVICARIGDSRLPTSPTSFAYLASGEGGVCGCCDQIIEQDDTSLQVEHGTHVVAMHPECFCEWRAVVTELQLGVDHGRDTATLGLPRT